jgi:predicted permease
MRWRKVLRRGWWDRERAREIEAYLEAETAENIDGGMNPADAAAAARRKFGNPVLVREEIYRMNTIGWAESAWQDLRYGARVLRMSPGFTCVAILSLALGIGANTAIFELLDAVRLRSLPVRDPQQLADVRIMGGNQGMGLNAGPYARLTRPIWYEIRRQQETFSGVFAWGRDDVLIKRGPDLQRARALLVSGEFFGVLGVKPWRGRLLETADADGACPESNAVVSYAYWQTQMGGRDLAADNKLLVDNELRQVVGVTPPEFSGLAVGESFDIALPFCRPKDLRRDLFDIGVMGRLRPGWTLERASAQLGAISPGIFQETKPTGYSSEWMKTWSRFRLSAYAASNGVSRLRTEYDSSLWLLLAITALVLLIACANLANLMLARASTRTREIAVRLALGASRRRLIRQLLAESGLLAVLGGALGIGLAQALSRVLVWALSTESGSVFLPVATDWRVLIFAGAVAMLTCGVFGVLPAIRASGAEPVTAMKSGGRGATAGRERFSVQRLMVVTQIAVSLVLLVGALLFVRSFRNLITFDPGIREEGITVAFIGFQQSHVARERYGEFKRELEDEVRATPGIIDAATTTNVPLFGGSWTHNVVVGSMESWSKFTWVSPSYFHTVSIPLLAGRGFTRNDTTNSQHVAVVNEAFVRKFLGGVRPIGKTMRTIAEPDYPSTVYEIVGIIPDTKYADLRGDTPPMTFAPAAQFPDEGPWVAMMVYSRLPPAAASAAVRRRVLEKHPEIILAAVIDYQRAIRDGLVRERLLAMLAGFFGLLAIVLATVGLYGVISYIVTRRRNEIGLRVALGARRGQVIAMMMREAAWLLVSGVVAGTLLALLAGRGASSLLFGLKANDPLTLAAAIALLGGITVLASFFPALRASRLDPMEALRCE